MATSVRPPLKIPSHEDILANAFRYACGVTDNARRKLTDADVAEQPNRGVPMWDQAPLTYLAYWYAREGGSDSEFILSLCQSLRRKPREGLTRGQIRGAVNVFLGDFKRGYKAPWMVTL